MQSAQLALYKLFEDLMLLQQQYEEVFKDPKLSLDDQKMGIQAPSFYDGFS